MRVYNYNEIESNLSTVFDSALMEEVIIKNKDGLDFKLSPVERKNIGRSPLEGIKGIKANVTTQELVEIIRECRAGI